MAHVRPEDPCRHGINDGFEEALRSAEFVSRLKQALKRFPHGGDEYGAVNTIISDDFIDVPEQIEQVGDVGVQGKAQLAQHREDRCGQKPCRAVELAQPRHVIEAYCRNHQDSGNDILRDDLEALGSITDF